MRLLIVSYCIGALAIAAIIAVLIIEVFREPTVGIVLITVALIVAFASYLKPAFQVPPWRLW